MTKRYVQTLAGLTALIVAATSCSGGQKAADETPVEPTTESKTAAIKILAFNDLHGHLDGPSGSVSVDGARVDAGGADYLAAKVAQIKRLHPNTLTVTAGDMIGASPLLSALFHDEPTIEALNEMTVDVASVGNHEFDEGVDELKRMMEGGCHPVDGCQDGDPYEGAAFPLLAANVTYVDSGESIFPGYVVRELDGVKIGFIGLTLEGTPAIVSAEGIKGLKFGKEADAINEIVPKLQAEGVETIIVLVHEGGYATQEQEDVNGCPGVSGPIVELVEEVDDAVDVFVTGHTHQAYICEMDGRLVTAAKSYGRLLTEIDLEVDRQTGDVVSRKATNLVIDRAGDPHPGVDSIKRKYSKLAAPLAEQKIGTISETFSRDTDENGESPLGRLIADIQLDATKSKETGAAQLALMNLGGIRAPLEFEEAGDASGIVTYADAHTVQPFGNSLVTMTLTGRQLHDLLESQFTDPDRVRPLQASRGFQYEWSASAPIGDKVDPKSIKLDGKVLDPRGNYRITVNSFLANGGDGMEVLASGTERIGGPIDLAALVAYFSENSPVKPTSDRRIKRVD